MSLKKCRSRIGLGAAHHPFARRFRRGRRRAGLAPPCAGASLRPRCAGAGLSRAGWVRRVSRRFSGVEPGGRRSGVAARPGGPLAGPLAMTDVRRFRRCAGSPAYRWGAPAPASRADVPKIPRPRRRPRSLCSDRGRTGGLPNERGEAHVRRNVASSWDILAAVGRLVELASSRLILSDFYGFAPITVSRSTRWMGEESHIGWICSVLLHTRGTRLRTLAGAACADLYASMWK
jgi:hypothetical protein